jgi:hypothetical protein
MLLLFVLGSSKSPVMKLQSYIFYDLLDVGPVALANRFRKLPVQMGDRSVKALLYKYFISGFLSKNLGI